VPDFPIVDAHLHLWDTERLPWPSLDATPSVNRTFELAELARDTQGVPIEQFVYVQGEVAPPFAALEVQWVVELTGRDPRITGIVGWAPLEYGDQTRPLLQAMAGIDQRVKGIRRITQFESDKAFCLRPGFVRGCQILPEYGLLCELCIDHTQLANTTELIRRCPETRFVLDHIAKPSIKTHLREPWWQEIATLAALPNVVCKVSEVANQADMQHWTVDDLRPYVERVIEVFGEDRIMYGAGYPIVLLACSYQRWHAAIEDITAGLSESQKHKFWADNARRVYQLPARVRGQAVVA
jgi:L-fuconolactonase